MIAHHSALLVAVLSLLSFSSAKVCDAAAATPQSRYVGTFTWQGRTLTVGPVSSTRTISGNFQAATATSGADQWTDWGQQGVSNLGFRLLKRQSSGPLDCKTGQACLNNVADIPFCLDERTGGWYGATGYEGNAVTGNYTTPNGQKGNTYQGPCPGDYYVQASKGCALIPPGQRAVASSSSSSSSSSPISSGTSTSTPTPNVASSLDTMSDFSRWGLLAVASWMVL